VQQLQPQQGAKSGETQKWLNSAPQEGNEQPLKGVKRNDRCHFVSFHSHTSHSHGDGFGTVHDHVERVANLGMTALALSEHGNCNSHVSLEKECKEFGIKPIFGCEIYFAPPKERSKTHLGIYAMNEEGYRNLNRIISQSYIDSYQYPTVSWENLVEHSNGIAVLSGCADSFINCTLLGGKFLGEKRLEVREKDYGLARKRIQRFQDIFGNQFYLEVQRFHNLERTCALNPVLAKLSSETNAPLLATFDVHVVTEDQRDMRKILHAGRRSSSVNIVEAEWEWSVNMAYPTNDEELFGNMIGTGLTDKQAEESIANTLILADRCNVELPKARSLTYPISKRDWEPW
jgi:Zierdtviridae DNA polymerase